MLRLEELFLCGRNKMFTLKEYIMPHMKKKAYNHSSWEVKAEAVIR
jgi:hypothetical protein